MPEPPDGTLTVLHTDIANSTALTLSLRDRYPSVLAQHRALLRAAFVSCDGHEVDTQGDSFFVVFRRATQAVAAAVQAQHALAVEAWPECGAVKVRIGIHTGEPIRTVEGYTGLDVIRGARIRDAGHGGQVLLSATAATLVQDALLEGLTLRDLGAFRLKGLPHAERIVQLIIPGLPSDFPTLVSLDSRSQGGPSAAAAGRVLTTLLFIDIAGAGARMVELGDRRWRELRSQFLALARRELTRHGGFEVNTVEDALFATFESPAEAIRSGCAIRDGVKSLGIEVRVGIHAGEVEREAQDLTGINVHVGARITGLASPGEIVVSRIVRDLVAGSEITFSDRGTYTLSGLPGEWQLFTPDP